MGDGAAVLYIHPWGHLNDLVVPAGALACLNAVRASKLGRYAFEVEDEEILAAKVIAVDVHWALALTGFVHLIQHVRGLRPDVAIVVGGVTAGHYAQELLDRFNVDYVLRGDSETSFAALVEALVEGREPGDLPNVYVRGRPPPPELRMSEAEFDATDSLNADWFPTYVAVSEWDAEAFPQGRTLMITRGCALRCPECYGSYASTYGRGYLMRSPEATVALLRQAERMKLRNVCLFVAKPAPKQLSALLNAIADAGPFRFSSAVGFYLCMPPSPEDVLRLDAAFDNPIALSFVPPDEQQPALSPVRLASERQAWRLVADAVLASRNLRLDLWSTQTTDAAKLRADLTTSASDRIQANYGGVWAVTRPEDGVSRTMDHVRAALDPVWTFYAARLLAPALARLLKPFRFLDEMEGDPSAAAPANAALAPFWEEIVASWARDRLPLLPTLGFAVQPIRGGTWSPNRRSEGAHAEGDFAYLVPTSAWTVAGAATVLERVRDHRGVELRGDLPSGAYDALILVPLPPQPGVIDDAWLAALGVEGFLGLRLPPNAHPARVSVHLRVQDARAFLLDEQGERLARGLAHLDYFRRVDNPRRGARRTSPATRT
jgi:hypothetical protein